MNQRDATNANVSYVDYSSSAASLGGMEDSALNSSLATRIRDCRIRYVAPQNPVFSEDPGFALDDESS